VKNKWRRRESNVVPRFDVNTRKDSQGTDSIAEAASSAPCPCVPQDAAACPDSLGQRPDSAQRRIARWETRSRGPGASRESRMTPEFASYHHAVSRCTNPKNKDYAEYGGRGIRVHPDWLEKGGFDRFVAEVGPRPSLGHTLGRIDNARGYEPGNVRWETWTEQQNNRRSNHRITIDGVTRSAADWAREVGLPRRQLVTNRIAMGWHPTAAVYGYDGECKNGAHHRLKLKPAREAAPRVSARQQRIDELLSTPVKRKGRAA
jgi:hypothetical protein